MTESQVIATWIAFMVTALRQATGWPMERFLAEDTKHGILRFLEENYDLLHYYGNDYVVADTLKYIQEHGGAACNP